MSYRRGASDVTGVALVSWITCEKLPDPLMSQAWLLCGASDVDNISYEQGYPPWGEFDLTRMPSIGAVIIIITVIEVG